ncbi:MULTISPECIES: hypothetical protein [Thalassolituus]|jgi:capsular polysaccharide export protein|uniref:capsular polysaccharide export protein, LipB/KpsS family n=1 Tax=Thalassolituus TaxID=187492 RepID=UPI00042DC935|nr:hypothetical protein [Thalassolituus oleivorans]AHK14789.1 polysaccharide synthesis/modification protein [Thalassolituus oleivorans R6-15]
MKLAFFAARRIHRQYFTQLSSRLNASDSLPSLVIWHKFLWLNPFALLRLKHVSLETRTKLESIVNDHIREKQNSRKGRSRSASYWKLFAKVKTLEARALLAIYQQALANHKISHLVVWNGLKFRQRVVVAAAESLQINPLFMENGLLPGMTTLDRKGINFLNSVPRDPQFFITRSGHVRKTSIEHKERPEELPEHYVFIPFQVNTDSQIVLFSPWLKDMTALVDALLKAESNLQEHTPNIVLKTHPACDQDYSELIKHLNSSSKKIRLYNSGDTQAFIAHADAVATINSTVGIEAIMANINILVLGQAFYNIAGLTLSAQSQAELEQALPQLVGFKPNPTIRQGLLHYLESEYQIPGRWQDADAKHIEAACAHLEQEVNRLG